MDKNTDRGIPDDQLELEKQVIEAQGWIIISEKKEDRGWTLISVSPDDPEAKKNKD
jgi:hypothetical protein